MTTRLPREAISGASRSYMRRFISSPWTSTSDALPLAVDLVGDPVAVVAERALLRHRVRPVYSTPIEAETAGRRGALPRSGGPQGAEDGARAGRAVERVEVDARGPAGQQLLALARGVGDPESRLGLGVAAERLHRGRELPRDRRVAEVADARYLGVARDRDHPGDDRDVDPRSRARPRRTRSRRWLSKKSWVIRKPAPASTLVFR